MTINTVPIGIFSAASVLCLLMGLDIKRRGRFSAWSKIPRPQAQQWYTDAVSMFIPLVTVVFPENVRHQTRQRLTWAGLGETITAGEFLAIKLASATILPVAGIFLSILLGFDFIWAVILAGIGYMVPDMWLGQKISKRQKQLKKEVLEFGLFFSTAIEAGGGDIFGALHISATKYGGDLGREIAKTVHDISTGKRRSEALQDLAERCGIEELTQLVDVIVQADRYGTPIAKAVREYTGQVRLLRRFEAEKAAGEAVVKMTFPMLLFIIMPLLILLAYPALQQIGRALGS